MRLRVLVVLFLTGCATVSPRFPQPIQADFAHHDMRVFETDALQLYYPAERHDEAVRIATRLDACVHALRGLPVSTRARPKLAVFLTDANFNNAYVQPAAAGFPQQMVLPQHVTLEVFNFLGLGPSEIGDISCHEAVHYVQMQQVDGFWHALNWVFGDLNQPNVFTESWFLEGLAVHYEGRLGKEVGRPHSPIWRGMYESGIAARRGQLQPGDLDAANRDLLPFGGNYVVGEHFVDYLAERYGEDKLWKLVDLQGSSIFSTFAVTLRFKSVYGKSIGALLDEYSDALAAKLPPDVRPPDQRMLASDLGPFPRLATGPDGAIATVSAQRDDFPRLTIREADGRVRVSRRIVPVLPGRSWILAGPEETSGMSFTADGRWLFLVMDDLAVDGDETARIWKIDAHTGDVVKLYGPIAGIGGAVRPDGRAYVYVQTRGDTNNLVERDLQTGTDRALTAFMARTSLAAPAYSPDGSRIAYSAWTGTGFDLFVREPDGTTTPLTHDGKFNYGARWLDQDRVLFMREFAEHAQAAVIDARTRELREVTRAPFIAFDPAPLPDGRIAFLDRRGWSFDLTTVPSAPGTPVVSGASLSPPVAATPVTGDDRAYSAFDHLLVPNLRVPIFIAAPDQNNHWKYFAAASIQGQDRLGYHAYAANVAYESNDHGPSFDLTYANAQLAPWYLAVTGGRADDGSVTDKFVGASVSRTFWDTPVALTFDGIRRLDYSGKTDVRSRLVGPTLSTSWSASDGTAYGGTRLATAVSLSVSTFPKALGSDFNLSDFRLELDGVVPLPLSHRHSLLLSLVGRTLPGAPRGLLEVGGVSSALAAYQSEPSVAEVGPNVALPGVRFREPLRGYEDATLRANRVAIAYARYRLHIPLDLGSASVLYLLPSYFAREIQVEAFGAWARTIGPDTSNHRVAGGALRLASHLGGAVPLTFFVQGAYRFDDGLPPLVLAGVALE
jgi:hypothetical protein